MKCLHFCNKWSFEKIKFNNDFVQTFINQSKNANSHFSHNLSHVISRTAFILKPKKKTLVCLCFFHFIFRVHFDFGLVSFLEPHQWNWINTKNQFTFQTDEMRWFRSLCKMPFGPFVISNKATTFKFLARCRSTATCRDIRKQLNPFFKRV